MIEIGDLAAILTATGISIYVLGLVGLAIPMRKITKDTSTAWYATSLIPRIVVAGQGARIWLGLPLILTAFTSLTSLFMFVVYPDLYVRIDKRAEDSTDGVGESLRGRLVAHSDGLAFL